MSLLRLMDRLKSVVQLNGPTKLREVTANSSLLFCNEPSLAPNVRANPDENGSSSLKIRSLVFFRYAQQIGFHIVGLSQRLPTGPQVHEQFLKQVFQQFPVR